MKRVAGPAGGRLVDLSSVLWGGRPPPHAAQQQHRLLHRRLCWLAVVFGLLMLAWIAVETAVLRGEQLLPLLLLRAGLAASLLGLAAASRRLPPMLGLTGLVLLQTAFLAAMREQLPADIPAWLRHGYSLFPFVLVAQLGILPLAALRTLLLALPVILLALMPLWGGDSTPLHSLLLDLWLLSLILALAMWASAAQLGLLFELLSARWSAAHDPMTGLANRQSVLHRLDSAIARSRRTGRPVSVLVFDLDHFKRVNDTRGHACGDRVICAAAAALRAELRDADDAGRIGGEEFVGVLGDTALAGALLVAERIRERIAATVIDCDDRQVSVTTSIGAAELAGDESAADLLARADAALYAAKADGRNRIEAAPSPQARPHADR